MDLRPADNSSTDSSRIDKKVEEYLLKLKTTTASKYANEYAELCSLYPPNSNKYSGENCTVNNTSFQQNDMKWMRPSVAHLLELITTDQEISLLFQQMFLKQTSCISHWQELLIVLNHVLTTAPEYDVIPIVPFPISILFDSLFDSDFGQLASVNAKINRAFKDILTCWSKFLQTSESCSVLNDHPENGWFGEAALMAMPNFADEYQCHPSAPHYGFKSWDDFFTRRLRPGVRPVSDSADDNAIVSACEAIPYAIQSDVKERDQFWMKGIFYSLADVLDKDELTHQFIGGTVYQAHLMTTSYHRWHSPVSGTIVKTRLVDGTYLAIKSAVPSKCPVRKRLLAQEYFPNVATRGIVFIQADSADIGLMAFVSVGMNEVSSNDITVKAGDRVNKGDDLGTFHFGGSTFCLIFRPEVDLSWDVQVEAFDDWRPVPVNSRIAHVLPQVKKRKTLFQ